MVRRGLRHSDGRALAGATLAGLLVLGPGLAAAQGSAEAANPAAVVGAGPRTVLATTRPSVDVVVAAPVRGASLPRIRLYRPPGTEPEPLRAAVGADVTTLLGFSGKAVYHPRPAVTVLDLEARVRTGSGPSLTLRTVSLHHLPGKDLPLRFRGRELRLALGLRIPVR